MRNQNDIDAVQKKVDRLSTLTSALLKHDPKHSGLQSIQSLLQQVQVQVNQNSSRRELQNIESICNHLDKLLISSARNDNHQISQANIDLTGVLIRIPKEQRVEIEVEPGAPQEPLEQKEEQGPNLSCSLGAVKKAIPQLTHDFKNKLEFNFEVEKYNLENQLETVLNPSIKSSMNNVLAFMNNNNQNTNNDLELWKDVLKECSSVCPILQTRIGGDEDIKSINSAISNLDSLAEKSEKQKMDQIGNIIKDVCKSLFVLAMTITIVPVAIAYLSTGFNPIDFLKNAFSRISNALSEKNNLNELETNIKNVTHEMKEKLQASKSTVEQPAGLNKGNSSGAREGIVDLPGKIIEVLFNP